MAKEFGEYLFEYDHDGATWGITILAQNEADARARMSRMSLARFQGTLIAKIPAGPSWLERLFRRKQATGEE